MSEKSFFPERKFNNKMPLDRTCQKIPIQGKSIKEITSTKCINASCIRMARSRASKPILILSLNVLKYLSLSI